ncbi:MAG: hypothetical protein NT162_02155 [Candidatus Woesebacteria bacterium]|nr:hypothetical protein [Candidatus Woesebacteria bacterium]
MNERPSFGKRIGQGGDGRIRIVSGSTVVTVEETAAPRIRKEGQEKHAKFFFPQGTIESLKPLLKDVFQVNGIERDEGFWLEIDDVAQMTPSEAYKKIVKVNKKFGGITAETMAEVVLGTDKLLHEAKAFGNISGQQIKGLESILAGKIMEEYKKSLPRRK